jgi:succinylglutamate desuccinylase
VNTQNKTQLSLSQANEILEVLLDYIEVISAEIVKADNCKSYRIVINGSDVTDGLLREVQRRENRKHIHTYLSTVEV